MTPTRSEPVARGPGSSEDDRDATGRTGPDPPLSRGQAPEQVRAFVEGSEAVDFAAAAQAPAWRPARRCARRYRPPGRPGRGQGRLLRLPLLLPPTFRLISVLEKTVVNRGAGNSRQARERPLNPHTTRRPDGRESREIPVTRPGPGRWRGLPAEHERPDTNHPQDMRSGTRGIRGLMKCERNR